jgi:hypothetical protein
MVKDDRVEKTGIFIEEITDKHIWIAYYHKDIIIMKQPLGQTFRDYLEPIHQKDIESGEVLRGFQPETAIAKLKLSKAIQKELDIA